MKRLKGYVDNCPVEISGFGLVRRDGERFFLDEVFILDQEVSAAHAVIRAEAIGLKDSELVREGRVHLRRFQWHSHSELSAYFSVRDVATIRQWRGEWLISMVLNKAGHFEARLDVFGIGVHRQRPLSVTILLEPLGFTDTMQLQEEIAEHVQLPPAPTVRGYLGRMKRYFEEGRSYGN
jgi:hypothetical protein